MTLMVPKDVCFPTFQKHQKINLILPKNKKNTYPDLFSNSFFFKLIKFNDFKRFSGVC